MAHVTYWKRSFWIASLLKSYRNAQNRREHRIAVRKVATNNSNSSPMYIPFSCFSRHVIDDCWFGWSTSGYTHTKINMEPGNDGLKQFRNLLFQGGKPPHFQVPSSKFHGNLNSTPWSLTIQPRPIQPGVHPSTALLSIAKYGKVTFEKFGWAIWSFFSTQKKWGSQLLV